VTHHHHPTTTTLTLAALAALAALAVAASTGTAAADSKPRVGTTVRSHPPAVQVIRVSEHGGFDWGDAGIGAAGGIGLSMLAVGGGLLIAGHRQDQPLRTDHTTQQPPAPTKHQMEVSE
jgi:hypothetical protein